MCGVRCSCGRCRSPYTLSLSRPGCGMSMKSALRRVACLSTGLLMCHAALAQLQGRSVGDVLKDLRAQGLIFIYNDQIVPASLRVEAEPNATRGLELAREILAAHGLSLSEA